MCRASCDYRTRVDPQGKNELADYVSKIKDYDDWMVHLLIFLQIDRLWGPHTVDLFANNRNTQLKWFNSQFWNPRAETVGPHWYLLPLTCF